MNHCQRYVISGHVQGVFYRASAQEVAQDLGLTGWVRNLPDGSVELLACGSADQLRQLQDWLWEGPRHARVDHVAVNAAEKKEYDEFEVRY